MEEPTCLCTGCDSESCGMSSQWKKKRGNKSQSQVCTWQRNGRCTHICKSCICIRCRGSGKHCKCDLSQPSGYADGEPADQHTPEVASGQSSEAYMWAAPTEMTKPLEVPTAGPVMAGAAQPKPTIPLRSKPPPKTKADPQSLTSQERVQFLEKTGSC